MLLALFCRLPPVSEGSLFRAGDGPGVVGYPAAGRFGRSRGGGSAYGRMHQSNFGGGGGSIYGSSGYGLV